MRIRAPHRQPKLPLQWGYARSLLVIYQNLFADYGLKARPLAMFLEKVQKDGKEMPRFDYISSPFEHTPPEELGGYDPNKNINAP